MRVFCIKLIYGFLDLLFPITCVICGTDGVYVCSKCLRKLPQITNQICIKCAQPAPFGKTHPACKTKNVPDGVLSALTYKDRQVKELIKIFKFTFVESLGMPLAQALVDMIKNHELKSYFQDFLIIPVPLHRRRFNWRGFNQAETLARELGKQLGISFNVSLVKRLKHTKPQTKLTLEERKNNLQNAFDVTSPLPNKKIILIDDVLTSGTTILELTRVLKQSGAKEVWAITLAHG
jgi:competence protein ComFC